MLLETVARGICIFTRIVVSPIQFATIYGLILDLSHISLMIIMQQGRFGSIQTGMEELALMNVFWRQYRVVFAFMDRGITLLICLDLGFDS